MNTAHYLMFLAFCISCVFPIIDVGVGVSTLVDVFNSVYKLCFPIIDVDVSDVLVLVFIYFLMFMKHYVGAKRLVCIVLLDCIGQPIRLLSAA